MLFSLLPRTGPSQPAHLMAWNLARNCLSLGSAQAEHRHLQLKCFTVSATNELPLLGVSIGRTSTSKHIIFQVLRQLDWTDLVLLQTHWTFPELVLLWLTELILDWPELILDWPDWLILSWTDLNLYCYWISEPILDWIELVPGTATDWLNLSWTDLNLYWYWLNEPILD